MKRDSSKIILVGMFCIILLMNFIVGYYMVIQNQIDYISRGLYSNDRINCIVSSEKLINWNELYKEGSYKVIRDEVIRYHITEYSISSQHIKGIYINNSELDVPIKSGRKFRKEDFYSDKRYALIGENVKENITKKDNKEYIEIKDELYEVIGKVGTFYESALDNLIIVNLDALDKDFGMDGLYNLDGVDKNKLYDNIIEKHKDDLLAIKRIIKEDKGISSYIRIDSDQEKMLLITIITMICSNVIAILYWLYRKRNDMKIYFIIGVRSKHLFTLLIKEFLILIIVPTLILGTLFNVIVYLTLPQEIIKFNINFLKYTMIVQFIGIILFSTIFYKLNRFIEKRETGVVQ